MISKLVLKNFCKFESKTISFQRGLNVLVGNNGSGKSMVLEAIDLYGRSATQWDKLATAIAQ